MPPIHPLLAELAGPAGAHPWGTLILPIALALAALFAGVLRRSLESFTPQGVLERHASKKNRERLVQAAERAKPLAMGARWIEGGLQVGSLAVLYSYHVTAQILPLANPRTALLAWVLGTTFTCMALWVMAPRAWVNAHADSIAARFLPSFDLLMRPILIFLRMACGFQDGLTRLFGLQTDPKRDEQVLVDLSSALRDQGENDHLDETAQELIRNVLDFRAADAAEVMTPRTEVVAIDVEDGLQVAMKTIVDSGHSRIPVYEGTIDSIIGTVTARRAIRESTKPPEEQTDLRNLLDPPILVPETKPVAELLRQFRAVKQKLAVVLDEYGGTAGIATLSDVVGEIVGDFLEEHHQETERIRQVDRDLFEVAASLHVSEVNEALHLTIPEEEDFETLGGFVLAQLGHIPDPGEFFDWSGTRYTVTEASDRRVMWMRVQRSA